MSLLCVWLPAVLLLDSVRTDITDGWLIPGADEVFAMEGASAVLPCNFTNIVTAHMLSYTAIWSKDDLRGYNAIVKCTYLSHRDPWCNESIQEAGGGRHRLVGNLGQKDASIMVERLMKNDSGQYRCNILQTTGIPLSFKVTQLHVRAPGRSVSVVTRSEGASAMLPCVFTRPPLNHILHTVTWVRKDPYRHIVTFRHHRNGSWTAENGETRYELVGDPKQGNASTRIKQLSAEDSDGYLCLVFRDQVNDGTTLPTFTLLFQSEIRLLVRSEIIQTDPLLEAENPCFHPHATLP
ncbi:uncharacterized protein LOC127572469 isoform X2 [Pristis pectinata]|uniref:uncharacterized protein LOC127572469 isoform X2 n=1 Tax=Pristis pectinata TaxID=685728 RepID=UPI00223E05EA|nr:uncharacterized protein LOC127572469 isoform X2 [Pristis pectinata]